MKGKDETRSPQELPGVRKKSMMMAYHGGMIWFEHLDGMYRNTELVLQKLALDAEIFRKPSAPSSIAINLDETKITPEIRDAICTQLLNGEKVFLRVVFVGVSGSVRRTFQKKLQKTPFEFAFINDFEEAKAWLIPGQ